eukprot:TRINITY_DN2029_c0_g1_i1.p1 TRINITY_DN2029_c0_g1~~TRINITY_DN2029_c0_g1_i1.p1  ORF type:complete len:60 (+),score=17.42 TRINITY_DN2029_c0_g1_i1:2-181(+)
MKGARAVAVEQGIDPPHHGGVIFTLGEQWVGLRTLFSGEQLYSRCHPHVLCVDTPCTLR